jgi:putative ABC transport system substrate-binding protein
MDRRTFIGTVAGGLVAARLDAAVEPAGKVYRIGWLAFGATPSGPDAIDTFRRALSELGWIEGRNIAIEARWAANDSDRLTTQADELVELGVDVIVTNSSPAALAAKKATTRIPIVMAGVSSPVERGLVKSLANPGENVTGMTNNPGTGFHQKMVQLLKEAAPRISRVAVLWSTGEEEVLREIQAAQRLGVAVVNAEAREPKQVPVALAAAVRAGADGLFVTPSPLNTGQYHLIADFAMANRLPSISGDTYFVSAGGLMSYWTDWRDVRRRSATYVDKILKGAKPGDLPIEQPTKLELVINLKTAKELVLTIPQSLLLRADKLIQ